MKEIRAEKKGFHRDGVGFREVASCDDPVEELPAVRALHDQQEVGRGFVHREQGHDVGVPQRRQDANLLIATKTQTLKGFALGGLSLSLSLSDSFSMYVSYFRALTHSTLHVSPFLALLVKSF
jgi:hypothetical protein